MKTDYDVIIIGGGAAGIGAGRYFRKTCPTLKYLILEADIDIGGRCKSFELGKDQ